MGRVVITGMGIYSCIGENVEEVKQSLIALSFLCRKGKF